MILCNDLLYGTLLAIIIYLINTMSDSIEIVNEKKKYNAELHESISYEKKPSQIKFSCPTQHIPHMQPITEWRCQSIDDQQLPKLLHPLPQTKLLFGPSLIICFTKPRNPTTSSKPTNENNILYSFRPKILCYSNMTDWLIYVFYFKFNNFINLLKVNYFILLNS